MITPEQLAEWRKIAEKATPGPWTHDYIYIHSDQFKVADVADRQPHALATIRGWGHLQYKGEAKAIEIQDANGKFIAHARNTYVQLLDEVESLHKVIAQERAESIRQIQTRDIEIENLFDRINRLQSWKANEARFQVFKALEAAGINCDDEMIAELLSDGFQAGYRQAIEDAAKEADRIAGNDKDFDPSVRKASGMIGLAIKALTS